MTVSTYRDERRLQLLRTRFNGWVPWLRRAVSAEVSISSAGRGNAFLVTATWRGGQYRKVYDPAFLRREGTVSCLRTYARAFVHEVLQARGVITEKTTT